MPETSFGAELRRLRLAAGLDEHELGLCIAKSAAFVAELEDGRRLPAKTNLRWMLRRLDASPNDSQRLRELAFLARGECCPRCGFGGEE